MRVLVTGASGWIGSAVVPELLRAGHHVIGLARSDDAAAAVAATGAEALRGELGDATLLRSAAEASDGVIHLAYEHSLGQAGGAETDAAAISTFVDALAGSDRPLLVTGATIRVPGRVATERDELVAEGPIAARILNLRAALAGVDRGVRVSLMMIPRSVHGAGETHGFIPQLVRRARERGVSGYIGDGAARWPAVHIRDAAALYRLAIEKAPAGSVLNVVGDEGVAVRDIADAIGRGLGVESRPLPAEEFGMPLAPLMATDMPASSAITRHLLGWAPTHPGLLDDIREGHYFD